MKVVTVFTAFLSMFHLNVADGIFKIADGKVGVDFLGFKAGAGIASDGQLHAGAGTPWGAQAAAGAGGSGSHDASGGLYAGATAGGGISAAAGLGGAASGTGSYGQGYAGASLGSTIKKTTVDVSAHHPPEQKPVKTIIEKTVIPNYEKKTIQVPSFEEKVVRVPTVVEKEVWVPAAPTVIEKEVQVPQEVPPPVYVQTVETYPVIQKTKFRKRPHFLFRKHFYGEIPASAGVASSATITKTVNPQFYSDIFNIPISTLGAVNKFVSGLSAGGSVSVSKSFAASSEVHH